MKKLLKKLKISTKKTVQPSIVETTMTTMSKVFLYLLIVTCGVLFYLHRFIPVDNLEVMNLRKKHYSLKQTRNNYFKELSNNYNDVNLVKKYVEARKQADLGWVELTKAKKNQMFYGFKSLHSFIERLGLSCLIFIYALFNLAKSFYFERKNTASKVFHTFIISVGLFYFFWMFNAFQDFNVVTYTLITLSSATGITLSIFYYTKYRKNKIKELQKDINELSRFAILNTTAGKQEEMFNLFDKQIKKNI